MTRMKKMMRKKRKTKKTDSEIIKFDEGKGVNDEIYGEDVALVEEA